MRSPNRKAAAAVIIATVLLAAIAGSGRAASPPDPVATLAPEAPPVGMHPSTAKLETVLAAWRAADGSAKKKIVTE